jgi:hypothetical protein
VTGVAVTLNFYFFSGSSSNTPAYTGTWDQAGFDLVGPNAPTSVTTNSADTELYLNWSTDQATDRSGFHIYCAPADSNATSNDSGAGGAGGATAGGGTTAAGGSGGAGGTGTDTGGSVSTGGAGDTGGSTGTNTGGATSTGGSGSGINPDCPSTVIVQGAFPPNGLAPSGTTADKMATSGIASGLINEVPYACAVSGFDVRLNDGAFSAVTCGTPHLVNDFYKTYRNAGGKGGGGFCSLGQRASAVGLLIPLASLVALALRRRRRVVSRGRQCGN